MINKTKINMFFSYVGTLRECLPLTRAFVRVACGEFNIDKNSHLLVWYGEQPVASPELQQINSKVISLFDAMNYDRMRTDESFTYTRAFVVLEPIRVNFIPRDICNCAHTLMITGYSLRTLKIYDGGDPEWYFEKLVSKFRDFLQVDPVRYPFFYNYLSKYGEQLNPFIKAHYVKKACFCTSVWNQYKLMFPTETYNDKTFEASYDNWRQYVRESAYNHTWWYSDDWIREYEPDHFQMVDLL